MSGSARRGTYESNFTAQKVKHLYSGLNITNKSVKVKTEDLIRLLDIRAPYGIPGGDTCKYGICLQLACRMYNFPFNRTEALKLCGVDSEVYRHTYGIVLKTLEITPQINLESVGIHLGIPHLTPLATKILTKYKQRVLKTIPDIQKPKVKFDSSPYISVPFALATEFRAVKLDRNTLLDVTETSKKDFTKLYDHMNELVMLPIKNELQKVSLKKRRPSPLVAKENNSTSQESEVPKVEKSETVSEKEDVTQNTTNNIENIEINQKSKDDIQSPSKPDERLLQIAVDIWDFSKSEDGKAPVLPKIIAQRKKQKEFEAWKEKVLQSNESDPPNLKRKIQTTLETFVPSKKQKVDQQAQQN